jgi:predicted enzyme related to lactoylglutathione lyase
MTPVNLVQSSARRSSIPALVVGVGIVLCAAGTALSAAAMTTLARHQDDAAVTGIGGVFFRTDDPERVSAWYEEHLGIPAGPSGATFLWWEHDDPAVEGRTVWAAFPRNTGYFGPGDQEFMINYRVRDLDRLLERLAAAGVQQADTLEEYVYGRFAWIVDLEGNRVELWEPPAGTP